MNALLRPFAALVLLFRRWLGRRRARRLLTEGLPYAGQAVAGLLPGPRPSLPLALRAPGPLLPAEGSDEFWALPTGARAVRAPGTRPGRLLRLSALPAPLAGLGVARLSAFRLDAEARPSALARAPSPALARPLASALAPWVERVGPREALLRGAVRPGLSALRPASLGLDASLRPHAQARPLPQVDPARYLWARAPRTAQAPRRVDLGVARPDRFGVDELGRLRVQRDAPPTLSERPLPEPPGRALKPRTPLGRAPLSRLDGRAFRLAPGSLQPANEEMQPPARDPRPELFVHPPFRREVMGERWMASRRVWGLAPLQTEWFADWWRAFRQGRGAREPVPAPVPEEIGWALEICKEQMLIRRDVAKDEQPPADGEFQPSPRDISILDFQHDNDLRQFTPPPEWVEPAVVRPHELRPLRDASEAYLMWRTLVDGLAEPA